MFSKENTLLFHRRTLDPFITKKSFLNFIKSILFFKGELRIFLNDRFEKIFFLKYRLINKWNFFQSLEQT